MPPGPGSSVASDDVNGSGCPPSGSNAGPSNRFVWYALALCLVLIVLAVTVPVLATALGIAAIGVAGWALAVGCSLLPLVVGQVWLTFGRTNA